MGPKRGQVAYGPGCRKTRVRLELGIEPLKTRPQTGLLRTGRHLLHEIEERRVLVALGEARWHLLDLVLPGSLLDCQVDRATRLQASGFRRGVEESLGRDAGPQALEVVSLGCVSESGFREELVQVLRQQVVEGSVVRDSLHAVDLPERPHCFHGVPQRDAHVRGRQVLDRVGQRVFDGVRLPEKTVRHQFGSTEDPQDMVVPGDFPERWPREISDDLDLVLDDVHWGRPGFVVLLGDRGRHRAAEAASSKALQIIEGLLSGCV